MQFSIKIDLFKHCQQLYIDERNTDLKFQIMIILDDSRKERPTTTNCILLFTYKCFATHYIYLHILASEGNFNIISKRDY